MSCVEGPDKIIQQHLEKFQVVKPQWFNNKSKALQGTCSDKGYVVGPLSDPCLGNETKIYLDRKLHHHSQMKIMAGHGNFSNHPSLLTVTNRLVESLMGKDCGLQLDQAGKMQAIEARTRARTLRQDISYIVAGDSSFCMEGRYFLMVASAKRLQALDFPRFKSTKATFGSCPDMGYFQGPFLDPCFPGVELFVDWNTTHRSLLGIGREIEDPWYIPTLRQMAHGGAASLMGNRCFEGAPELNPAGGLKQ